uniref:Putative secreted protein n=1 Tax=Ixodes ricinus TaxID=34613 RepID=A0A6B0UAQ1_IXORI
MFGRSIYIFNIKNFFFLALQMLLVSLESMTITGSHGMLSCFISNSQCSKGWNSMLRALKVRCFQSGSIQAVDLEFMFTDFAALSACR